MFHNVTLTFAKKTQHMISLFPIFLIAPGLLAQDISVIYNSIYQSCRTNSSSQNGCGPNLVCIDQSFYYSQCLPSSQLDNAFQRSCSSHIPCPEGSYCGDNVDNCSPCKSKFTSCEVTDGFDLGCCPDTTCTSVSAYVNGDIQAMKVCLPPDSTPAKRWVRLFCYNGCPRYPFCPFGYHSLCANSGSGAIGGNPLTHRV